MITPLDIAVTGMAAQTRRLEASASNTANVRSRGALPGATADGQPEPYRPVGVAQSEQRAGTAAGGTRAVFTPITPAYLPEYDSDAPYADARGLVAAPNVDLAREAVDQVAASRTYAANAAVVRTADDLLQSLLDAKV
ncbi:flagellar basal body rod protein FlgC [Azospirillum sp. ST 5-10]|uniref:flagellar basal body rod protein FlgC n=1 Tax=unclassified Azospirillum TaxID=2630922 RepID=UPI003F4A4827